MVFLLLAALTIAAQLAGLAWVAQGQVDRGRALHGGRAVARLITTDPCLDPRVAARVGAGGRCGTVGMKPKPDMR